MKNYLIILLVLAVATACEPTPETAQNPAATPAESSPRKASVAEIEEGIRHYIDRVSELHGGVFPVPYQDDTLLLRLVRVHTEYLSNLGPGRQFACVDLVDLSGDVYDVDFFLSGKPGSMEVTETTVHKLNGKPFYTWKQQKDKTWKRLPVKDAGNRLLGVVEGEDRFTFRYEVTLPPGEGTASVWIPVPTSDEFQEVEPLSVHVHVDDYQYTTDTAFGNRIFFAQVALGPEEQSIAMDYLVNRKEKSAYSDPNHPPEDYLGARPLLPVGGRFTGVLQDILRGREKDPPLMQARAIYDHIIDTVRYRKAGEYGTGDANHACDALSGNCTEFHSLFISLARTAGIPARFAIGAAIPSDRNEGGIDGYHCWAEFYADDKWWPVDISEANKYSALATYYFGHHPANRIELSRGRNLQLVPPPASGRVPFFAYPLVEINGKAIPVRTYFSFEREGPIPL
ncbi:MAG: transglutaminase domain-containing protein [Cryomorphaceae bacterium]|nr:MAG: transglutaminase domain-containing protein [Cryomorphaceae bacterium]